MNGQFRLLINIAGGIFQQAHDAAWKFIGLVNLPVPVPQSAPVQIGMLETTLCIDVDGN